MSPITGVILILFLCGVTCTHRTPCIKDIVKPGQCPAREVFCFVPPREDGICTRDCHCPEKQKCCVLGCEYACVDIGKVKPGNCKASTKMCGHPIRGGPCRGDGQCPGDLKCCISNCEYKCMKPDSPGPPPHKG